MKRSAPTRSGRSHLLVGLRRPAMDGAEHGRDNERHNLRLTFDELVLIQRSLQAVKTLRALPPEDELLDDTMQLVDQALAQAFRESA